MKTKLIILLTCLFATSILTASQAIAQLPSIKHSNVRSQEIENNPNENKYTFRLYQAPKGAYGYDILKNGKLIFHQFALTFLSNDGKRFFPTKEQAEKAAAFGIEKIRKGVLPSTTEEEIKKIATQ